jgi:short subunit dehydrogenase-like uncharacterized protein
MPSDRELDVVVFGATGFVGRLVAEYLAEHAPEGVRIGLAGRSEPRLDEVRGRLGERAAHWPLLLADVSDQRSLVEMAADTSVLVTTVGPYRPTGLPVVEACVTAGSHYADLSGELLFMHDSVERYHERAASAGVRVVHACGFDSIPSDLGVLALYDAVRGDGAGELEDTTLVVTGLRGGVSGGTIASMKGQVDDVRANPEDRRVVADPYGLSPDHGSEPSLGPEPDLFAVEHHPELGGWIGPFVMAGTNTRVVRRSNALQDWAYGRRFRYREVTGFGPGPFGLVKAAGMTAGLGAFAAGIGFGPTRALLDYVLPGPGHGPGESTRRNGYFRIDVHTRTSSGARYVGRVAARGDPGYGATSVMLAESALCLALDSDRLPPRGGVLTPATAMGMALVQRLRAAGQTYEAERTDG